MKLPLRLDIELLELTATATSVLLIKSGMMLTKLHYTDPGIQAHLLCYSLTWVWKTTADSKT